MHGRFCQMEDMSANSFSPKHSRECYFTVVWNSHPSCLCNSNCHLCGHVSYMMQAHYSYFPLSVLILFQEHSVKVAVKLSLKKNPNLVRVVHTTLFLCSSLLCVSRGPCCLDYCGFIVQVQMKTQCEGVHIELHPDDQFYDSVPFFWDQLLTLCQTHHEPNVNEFPG